MVHRLLGCLQLVGLLVLAGAIPTAIETNATVYALTYALVRGILLLEYIRAWHYVPDARPYIRVILIGFSISILIWIASIGVPAPYRYALWAVALVIELTTPITSGGKIHRDFPPDVRHLPERYGLFTLLVQGQAVTGIVQGLVSSPFHTKSIVAACLGGILIFGLWWAYFDRLDDDAVRELAQEHVDQERAGETDPDTTLARQEQSKPTIRRYTFWIYVHLPLTMALTVLGVALIYIIRDVEQPLSSLHRWLLTGSVGVYLLAEAGISFTTLRAGPAHVSFKRGMAIRLGTGVAVLLVGWLTNLEPLLLLSTVTSIVMALIISDQLAPDRFFQQFTLCCNQQIGIRTGVGTGRRGVNGTGAKFKQRLANTVPILPNQDELPGGGYGHYIDPVGVFKQLIIRHIATTHQPHGVFPNGEPGCLIDIFRLFDRPRLRVVGVSCRGH